MRLKTTGSRNNKDCGVHMSGTNKTGWQIDDPEFLRRLTDSFRDAQEFAKKFRADTEIRWVCTCKSEKGGFCVIHARMTSGPAAECLQPSLLPVL